MVCAPQLLDYRRLYLIREIIDGINFAFDIIHELGKIPVFCHLDSHSGDVFQCLAPDFIDIIDPVDYIFKTLADCQFNILGTGAGVRHSDLKLLGGKFRKCFTLQCRQG